MKKILLALGLVSTIALGTQIIPESVSIGTQVKPHSSASLDLNGTSKGFLPNRLTTAQRDAIVSPATGLLIYNTTLGEMQVYSGATWTSVGAGGAGGIAYWVTTTSYIADDLVIESNRIWRCVTPHTSSVFATDIANWTEVSKVDLSIASGTLPIANGGTGSATQNFVDLSSVQSSIAGAKTFTSQLTAPSLVASGTAGSGYVLFPHQSSQPSAPAAGNVLLHGITNNGFTRLEHNSEALNPLVLGQDTVFVAKNVSGAPITIGQVVYVNGSTGAVPNVTLARSNAGSTVKSTIGIATESSVADNSFGQFMTGGILDSVNTNAFNAGDILYVDPTTPGALTSTKPAYPNYDKEVGIVLNKGIGNGSILVNISAHTGGSETGTDYATFTAAQLVSNVTTGTPPLVVSSTTPVANLSIGGNAATATSATSATNFSGSLSGDVSGTQSATSVNKINGTSLAGLGTGILKNTTGTGVPSIAVAGDFPTLNQNTTGTAAGLSSTLAIGSGGTGQTTKAAAFDALSPMTTAGDTIIGGASGTGTRLAVGKETNVKRVVGGTVAWSEEDRSNLLVNPNFEDSALTGWTCTTGTCTSTAVSGEFSEGLLGYKITTGSPTALSISQSVATLSGSTTQYVVGISYRVPATITDFQICTLIAGSEKTCVPSANLIADGAFHTIEIPEVITPGSTVGIKAKTTATYSANVVYLDKAYIKQGLGTQALQLDNVYTAQVSATGVISNLNKTGWLSGNCSVTNTAQYDCPVTAGIFSVVPNCIAQESDTAFATFTANQDYANSSISNLRFRGNNTSTQAATAKAFTIYCQKSGNDYLAASSAVYSQASANYSRTAYTPTFTNLGTPTSVSCYHSRDGEYLDVDCSFVMPASGSAAAEARISLPNGLTSSVASIRSVGMMSEAYSSAGYFGMSMLAESGTSYLTIGRQTSALNATAKVNGDQLVASVLHIFHARVPITGWSNAPTIVGSFAGVSTVPGASSVQDIYTTVTGGGTNGSCTGTCTPVNMKGFSTPTRNSAGNYTNTFSTAFTVAPICHITTSALNASNAIGCCRVSTTTTAATVVCNMCTTGGAEDVAYHLRCVGDK